MQSANMTFYFEKRSSDITYSQKRKQVKGYLCCKISESNITLPRVTPSREWFFYI